MFLTCNLPGSSHHKWWWYPNTKDGRLQAAAKSETLKGNQENFPIMHITDKVALRTRYRDGRRVYDKDARVLGRITSMDGKEM